MSVPPSVTQWTQLVATQLPALEPAPGPRARAVEPGAGAGPLLRAHRRQCVRGQPAGSQGKHGGASNCANGATRPPPNGAPQRQALAVETCFCALAALGLALGGTGTNWPWPWMPPRWATGFAVLAISVLYRGLRHPGGLGRLTRYRQRGPGKPSGCACCSRCRPPCRPP